MVAFEEKSYLSFARKIDCISMRMKKHVNYYKLKDI